MTTTRVSKSSRHAVAAEDLGAMPIVKIGAGVSRAEVKGELLGGCAVAFWTQPQYEAYSNMLAEMNDSLTVHDKAFVMCLVLDEADKFVGDPTSAYATTFHRMCGFDGYRQRNGR